MGGIRFRTTGTLMPRAMKLGSAIASYIFEEQYREMELMSEKERDIVKQAAKVLLERASKTAKPTKN